MVSRRTEDDSSMGKEDATFATVVLARLFHTVAFNNSDTRVTQKTLALSTEYLRMFTREAVARSNEVRIREAGVRMQELEVQMAAGAEAEAEQEPGADQQEAPPQDDEDYADELVQDTLTMQHLKEVAGLLILDF